MLPGDDTFRQRIIAYKLQLEVKLQASNHQPEQASALLQALERWQAREDLEEQTTRGQIEVCEAESMPIAYRGPEPYEPTPEDWEDWARWSDRLDALRDLHVEDERLDREKTMNTIHGGQA